MPKPAFTGDKIETPSDLLTRGGKVRPGGLLAPKKPTLQKYSVTRANGLPRRANNKPNKM